MAYNSTSGYFYGLKNLETLSCLNCTFIGASAFIGTSLREVNFPACTTIGG